MNEPNLNKEPRWRSTGYWVDSYENEDREGDRSRSRNYDRDDMRRYAQRSVDQGNRLRSMRGGREPDYHPNQGRRDVDRSRAQPDRNWGDPRYSRQRDSSERYAYDDHPGYDPRQGTDRPRPGRDRMDNYWGAREQQRISRDRGSTGQQDWWDTNAGRPDYTSARRIDQNDLDFDYQQQGEVDERSYDMDPGFAYEFGTDYDFMRDANPDNFGRNRRDQEGFGPEMGERERRVDPRGQVRSDRQQGRAGSRNAGFWNTPGPYAGVGPEGYRRPDQRIEEDICESLEQNSHIDARGITVQVQDGEVTLSGSVEQRNQKRMAADIAEAVWGVQHVDNNIRVKQQ